MEQGFYPAGLFEHVAKMSRLADPEDLLASEAPVVPPVRIRRNFVTNSGKDMKVDTLNLSKSQVKASGPDITQVPPTIAHTPPTPEMIDRTKAGVPGAVPPYEPGPMTSRKLSTEKKYIKERMRRRDSESSSAATASSQQEASSNKENTRGDSTPDSREKHHKRSRKKHKKHKRKDGRKERESSHDREKKKVPRGEKHGDREHKKHKERSRSRERDKVNSRSRSLDETASESTLVGTEVSTVSTEVQQKDLDKKSRDRSHKDKKHGEKRRSRSHSHRRSAPTSKDSVKSERESVKGRNMRALPHHSHQFNANTRPKSSELLNLLMNQQYYHQVEQEAQMAAKVLVNRAYRSPDKAHTSKDKKIQELLHDAYPLSQRSGDSAKDSVSLPPMSPIPGSSHHPESVQTEPVSGRRNPRLRQHSVSPPRAGSALERLLTEGNLVHTKNQQRKRASGVRGLKHSGQGAQTRWSSYPGPQPAWGQGAPQRLVGVDKEVLLKAIREEIRLLHGPEAVKS